jgi:hypothetical protein
MLLLFSKRLESKPLEVEDRLWHLFKEQSASAQLERDLLTCRETRERLVKSFVSQTILRQPSIQQRPQKKQYLKGWETAKVKTQKAKDKEKIASRKSLLVMKRLLEAERQGRPLDSTLTVINPIPLALFDTEGEMRKGTKSGFNRYLVEKEFPETLSNQYSATRAWILEAMFMINSVPLGNCTNIEAYGEQLVGRWIKWRLAGKSHQRWQTKLEA